VELSADPADKRAKRVRRTPRGDEIVLAVRDLLDATEERWRAEVGPQRYAIFREVLEELVDEQSRHLA
jgi:DNA-binding MarR family transcriptional regulator